MFLHLGNDISVRTSDIISIHDYDIFDSEENRAYLESMKKKNAIIDSKGLLKDVKSLIVTEDRLYLSAISSSTLKRRAAAVFRDE